VSAHEFWGGRRRANVSALPRYIEKLAAGRRPLAMDVPVSREEGAREGLVLGLRLSEGVPSGELEEFVRASGDRTLARDYASWKDERLLEEVSGRLRLTERGFLVSNEILCRFV
jgi:coproporphyrinogen III oxidase-like Fe-S oxidoreductase